MVFAFRSRTVCEYYGEAEPVRQADRNKPSLAVIPARILHHQHGTIKDQRGEFEVKPTVPEIGLALAVVPGEPHFDNIRMYIHSVKSQPRESNNRPRL